MNIFASSDVLYGKGTAIQLVLHEQNESNQASIVHAELNHSIVWASILRPLTAAILPYSSKSLGQYATG